MSTIPMELSSIDLKVMYCKDLKGFNFFQKLSVYALVSVVSDDPEKKLDHKQQHRTPTDKEGDGNPEWKHEMQFDLKGVSFHGCDHLFIHFELRHEGVMFGDKNIGEVRVPCKDLIQDSNGSFKFVNYEVRTTDGKPNGVLCFAYKVNGTGFPISHHHHHHHQTPEILYPPINVQPSAPEVHIQSSGVLYPPINVHSSAPEVLYSPPVTYYPASPPLPPPPHFPLPYLPPPPPLIPPSMAHGEFYHPPYPSDFYGWAPEPHMGFYGPPAGHSHSFGHGEASATHFPAWRDDRSSSWNGR